MTNGDAGRGTTQPSSFHLQLWRAPGGDRKDSTGPRWDPPSLLPASCSSQDSEHDGITTKQWCCNNKTTLQSPSQVPPGVGHPWPAIPLCYRHCSGLGTGYQESKLHFPCFWNWKSPVSFEHPKLVYRGTGSDRCHSANVNWRKFYRIASTLDLLVNLTVKYYFISLHTFKLFITYGNAGGLPAWAPGTPEMHGAELLPRQDTQPNPFHFLPLHWNSLLQSSLVTLLPPAAINHSASFLWNQR